MLVHTCGCGYVCVCVHAYSCGNGGDKYNSTTRAASAEEQCAVICTWLNR